jgi:hypothetical protein
MAQNFPCPNPACSHVFKAAEVQAQSEVSCPRCGFQLKGRAAAKARTPKPPTRAVPKASPAPVAKPANVKAPPAAKKTSPPIAAKAPVAQPVPVAKPAPAKVPIAQQVTPAPPKIAVAQPVAPPPAQDEGFDVELIEPPADAPPPEPVEEAPAGTGPLIRTRAQRGGFPWTRILVGVGALFTAACVVGGGYLAIVNFVGGDSEALRILQPRGGVVASMRTKNGNEKMFQLAVSDKVWLSDRETKNKIKAPPGDPDIWFAEAWKHSKDDVWFAIVAKDFGNQKPRDAEMVRVTVDKLEALFGEAVEAEARAEATKFVGLPAQRLHFKGLIRSSSWQGDCYMFFKSGFAFWFFLSSPDVQALQTWAEELQREDVFAIQVERRGWREQPPPTESFAASDSALTLTGLEGIWEKQESRNEDERGILMLFGRYRKEKDNRKNASVLVFKIDHQADLKEAVKAARADIETKKKEENTNYKLTTAAEIAEGQSEAGESADLGSRPGRMADLCLKINEDPKRYILLGVVNEPETCYVFRCECPWESRQIWRQDFLELLRSLRMKK